MTPEEAFAELEAKVERQERAMRAFFEELASSNVTHTIDIEVAGGIALNILNGRDG